MRKVVGLVIADENELHNFNQLKFVKQFINKFHVNLYEFKNFLIYVIHSKIGIVNSAIATQFLIDEHKVEEIWNYGAVGGSNKTKLHQVIIPKKFYYFDVSTPWYKYGQVPQEKEFYINSFWIWDDFNIASGQSFIDNLIDFKKIKNKINIDLIDMESCAIAQTCFKNKINFYCVKSISDIIGNTKNDLFDINNSIRIASKKAFDKLLSLMGEREK